MEDIQKFVRETINRATENGYSCIILCDGVYGYTKDANIADIFGGKISGSQMESFFEPTEEMLKTTTFLHLKNLRNMIEHADKSDHMCGLWLCTKSDTRLESQCGICFSAYFDPSGNKLLIFQSQIGESRTNAKFIGFFQFIDNDKVIFTVVDEDPQMKIGLLNVTDPITDLRLPTPETSIWTMFQHFLINLCINPEVIRIRYQDLVEFATSFYDEHDTIDLGDVSVKIYHFRDDDGYSLNFLALNTSQFMSISIHGYDDDAILIKIQYPDRKDVDGRNISASEVYTREAYEDGDDFQKIVGKLFDKIYADFQSYLFTIN